ncbi:GLG2 [Candida oxycetoniae]|uniref:glycogenin glucosyltransferase n=1 Tax=Candida oxycetoniae TaxID=497107 RepID=A0AAI9T0I6_9ASCO|nr:GLG2 [Candida oxycetoniae]KAI3406182.2 GLG2 [Candida oxycetoniae]
MTAAKAYVTLLVGESYLPGVLLLGRKLRELKTAYKLAILLNTETISQDLQDLIATVYDDIIAVNTIHSPLIKLKEALNRPELSITYTKLLLWSLTQYESIVYLDADVLPLQNMDDIFDKFEIGEGEIAASPDSGWPDTFNSGVFKLKPSKSVLDKLIEFAAKGELSTFDGADQGLFNEFFPNWIRLPYLYNVTPNFRHDYQFLPAFNRFFKDIKALHYIGDKKPWHFDDLLSSDLNNFHQYWWNDFNKFFDKSLKHKLLNLRGEASSLEFNKIGNKWNEPVASEEDSKLAPVTDHPAIFPWEHRDKREATRVFYQQNFTFTEPSSQSSSQPQPEGKDKDDSSFTEKLNQNSEKLKGTKISSSTPKNAPLSKEYGFGQENKNFNPDQSLAEVSKLPIKFLSKEKAKRETKD